MGIIKFNSSGNIINCTSPELQNFKRFPNFKLKRNFSYETCKRNVIPIETKYFNLKFSVIFSPFV